MWADDLRREALALSDGERAALAADLLATLDEPAGDDAETVRLAWAQEIERRAAIHDRGVLSGALGGGPAAER